ncbi:MAG: hypothetical protein ACI310_00455 [Bacilli bacterium]
MSFNDSGKFYADMTEEEKAQTILEYKDKYLNKVQILFNMLNYSFHNYNSIFSEEELQQIKQTSALLSQIQTSLNHNFEGNFDFSQFQKDMLLFINLEKSTRNISFKVLKSEMTKPDQFYPNQRFAFIVHVPTDGTNNDSDEKFKVTSTSLITDRSMGLYDDGFGKFGYILDFDLENFIVSSTADLYSSLYPQEEFDNEDYYLQFYKNDMYVIETDEELFQMSETCVAIPHYMEQVNTNTTIEVNGEPLNYDEEEIYNEIVLLNNDKLKKVGIFVRTVGDKNFNKDYLKAMQLAQKTGLPLIEIDKSLYRQKAGLKPLTLAETKEVVNNVGRRIKKNPDLYSIFQEKYKELSEAYAMKGKKYAPGNLCLKIYRDLKKVDHILTDEELQQFISSINKDNLFKKEQQEQQDVNFVVHHPTK